MLAKRHRITLLIVLAAAAAPAAVRAQGKLDASYTVTLAGIPIGRGDWTVNINDTRYTAQANGTTTGLMRVLTGGQGATTASGTIADGAVISSTYLSTITSNHKTNSVHFSVDAGNVKDTKIEPPEDHDPQRLPVTDSQRQGVLDPMSASLMRTPGTGEPVSPEACKRTLPIFDGRMRYDLQLEYKRMEKVKVDRGYNGPAVVCAVYFTPLGGYIPSRAAIRYISKMRDMEVWLAPIAGTRVLVPVRAEGPTPIGPVVFEADKFVSLALPSRASATGSKTQ